MTLLLFMAVMASSDLHAFVTLYDKNRDERLSFEEFKASVLPSMTNLVRPALVDETFRLYDLNRDGFVTEIELRHVVAQPPDWRDK